MAKWTLMPAHGLSLITECRLIAFVHNCLSVAEWLACWTQVQKGPGSNRSSDAVG